MQDWSFYRQGERDQARHLERIRRAIRERLPELIAEEIIQSGSPGAELRLTIQSLVEDSFRYDNDETAFVAERSFAERLPGGHGCEAGTLPGEEWFETALRREELADILWEELELGPLRPISHGPLLFGHSAPWDVAARGSLTLWDRRKSLLQSVRRQARSGVPAPLPALTAEDLRFRTWRHTPEPVGQAVVIAIRDVSGSMGALKKHLTRTFFFWALTLLRRLYPEVVTEFICHHTTARIVDEEAFFQLGESGGTKVSSAYELCRQLLSGRYRREAWNSFVIHFSDGDNWGERDNQLAESLLRESILPQVERFQYVEVREGSRRSPLYRLFEGIAGERLVLSHVAGLPDLLPALRQIVRREER